jgi:hypothetical protein
MRRSLLLSLATAAALAVAAPAAPAQSITVGIGDQQPAMFEHDAFKSLKLKRVRYFVRWNAMRDPYQRGQAEQYVAAARRAGVQVFMHVSTDDLRRKRGRLPTVAQYRREVGGLVRHFRRQGVREWGVWNEANHDTQPTYRSPRRAAEFFRVFWGWRGSICRGCTIVGLDVLDQKGVESYIRRFNQALPATMRRRLSIVGIHNYSEVNRRYTTRTRNIIRAQRRSNSRTKFWYTETGGVVAFSSAFPCNEGRASARTKYMFDLARRHRAHITRLYVYQWTGTDCTTRFDAGLTRADGTIRPAYSQFVRGIRRPGFKR